MKLVGGVSILACGAFALVGCNQALNDSKTAANVGAKAYGQKQYDTAITEYQKAIEKYKDNHVAWYGLGASYIGRGDWEKASEAFSKAVAIDDKQSMYQMYYGVSLYEKAVKGAREDQAKKLNKKPEEVSPDLSGVNFDTAVQHLQEAVKINGDLWRAHYYLGRIYREGDKAKDAADEFTKSLQADPRASGPYIALSELYRRWDYTDQAIQVASQGAVNVPDPNEQSDIWYVLGMGYDDKMMHDKAIEAFDKAIESKKDNHKAKFQRGQAYFRKGDFTHAKRDLEEFSKSSGASLEFAKQQATKMLMDIAAKSAPPAGAPGAPDQKMSPEEMVKKGGKGFQPPPKKK